MKVIILNSYFDKGLNRQVEVDEVLDLDEDRIEVLKSIGVGVKEYNEDLDDDESDEDLDDEIAKMKLLMSTTQMYQMQKKH